MKFVTFVYNKAGIHLSTRLLKGRSFFLQTDRIMDLRDITDNVQQRHQQSSQSLTLSPTTQQQQTSQQEHTANNVKQEVSIIQLKNKSRAAMF